jgi:hypothetical protein
MPKSRRRLRKVEKVWHFATLGPVGRTSASRVSGHRVGRSDLGPLRGLEACRAALEGRRIWQPKEPGLGVRDPVFGFRAAGTALRSNVSYDRGEVVRWIRMKLL